MGVHTLRVDEESFHLRVRGKLLRSILSDKGEGFEKRVRILRETVTQTDDEEG